MDKPIPSELLCAVAQKHGWSIELAEEKIEKTQEILLLGSLEEAAKHLLKVTIVRLPPKPRNAR